jgi:hypothetical protein
MSVRRPLWQRTLAVVATVVVALWVGAGVWVKLHEPDLVFLAQMSKAREVGVLPEGAQRVAVPSRSGLQLAGVQLGAVPARDTGYWVLHLHGNSVSAFSPWELRHLQLLSQWGVSMLAFDYRGFGQSPGEASEQNLMDDSQDAWAYLRDRGVPANRILIWGHSLGSGPATWLATQQSDAAALVLFGGFTSVPDAGSDDYPWLPVHTLATIQFNSRERLPQVKVPVVVAHSPSDSRIRYRHGQQLFAAANEPKRFVSVMPVRDDKWGGHVDALYDNLTLLDQPLRELLGAPVTQALSAAAP